MGIVNATIAVATSKGDRASLIYSLIFSCIGYWCSINYYLKGLGIATAIGIGNG